MNLLRFKLQKIRELAKGFCVAALLLVAWVPLPSAHASPMLSFLDVEEDDENFDALCDSAIDHLAEALSDEDFVDELGIDEEDVQRLLDILSDEDLSCEEKFEEVDSAFEEILEEMYGEMLCEEELEEIGDELDLPEGAQAVADDVLDSELPCEYKLTTIETLDMTYNPEDEDDEEDEEEDDEETDEEDGVEEDSAENQDVIKKKKKKKKRKGRKKRKGKKKRGRKSRR